MSMRVLESQQCMPRVLRMSSMVWRQRNQSRQRRRRILRATLPLSGQCPMMLSSTIMCCIASGPKEFFVCFMWWMGFFMHFFRQNSKLCVLMAVWIRKQYVPGVPPLIVVCVATQIVRSFILRAQLFLLPVSMQRRSCTSSSIELGRSRKQG